MKTKVYYVTNGTKSAMVEAFDKNMAYSRFFSKLNIFPTPTEFNKVRLLGVYVPDSDDLKSVILKNNLPLFKMNPTEINAFGRYRDRMHSEEFESKITKLLLDIFAAEIDALEEDKDDEEENVSMNSSESDTIGQNYQLAKLLDEQSSVCAEIMKLKEKNEQITRQIKAILDR